MVEIVAWRRAWPLKQSSGRRWACTKQKQNMSTGKKKGSQPADRHQRGHCLENKHVTYITIGVEGGV